MSLTLPDYLAIEGQRGCQWSITSLFHYHQRMIRLIAGKAMSDLQSHDRDDLESEVRLAMLELLKSWKHGAGCSFATYCFNWIPMHLRRRLDSTGYIVKLPAWAGLKDRREGNQAIPFSTTLYAPTEDGEEILREEVENYHRPTITESDRIDLAKMIGKLTSKQQQVVHKVLAGYSLSEIADDDGLTPQAVSAMYRSSVAKLRGMAKAAK